MAVAMGPATRESSEGVPRYNLYIGGQFVAPKSGDYFPTTNPTTGARWAEIPAADAADVDAAVAAARACFESESWRSLSPTARGRLLRRFGDILADHAEEIAAIETRDNGKLYKEMLAQARSMPSWFEYYGGLADKIEGSVVPLARTDVLNYTTREPLGVVAAFTPWNSPLLLLATKAAPALATGNVLVVKPSEHTSASTLEFARLFQEADFPLGALNVVTGAGPDAGQLLAGHPGVDKVAFTGGGTGGRAVASAATEHFASVTLELGGKSPNIVFADADLAAVESGVLAGIFAASGQTCVAGSRLFVQEPVADELLSRLASRAEGVVLGDPMDEATQMGPVATETQLQRISDLVEAGVSEGASLVTGGRRASGDELGSGYFYEPTIFGPATNSMTIAREEVFGPVLTTLVFRDEEEVIAAGNDTPYGLAAGIWTNDIKRAHRVARRLDAGTIWINMYRALAVNSPFGGFKGSGIGRENGLDVVREYTQTKSVWVQLSDETPDPFSIRL